MKVENVDRPRMILAGIAASSENVSEMDIGQLWDRFIERNDQILHQVNAEIGYELHIEEERLPRMHFCLIGVEVSQIEPLHIEVFNKVILAGKYLMYTHHFSKGGYGKAFKMAYDWLKYSDYEQAYDFDIQRYDDRFKGSEDLKSIFEILIPVKAKA